MNKFWGLPYFIWLTLCLLVAIAYFAYVPKEANSPNISSFERFIIKYAHSAVWLMLAAACLFFNYKKNDAAKSIALAAFFTYVVFIVTFFKIKK